MSYSNLCYHDRIERIDDTFVQCLQCGESMVNQSYLPSNKRMSEYKSENDRVIRNFDRNFTNIINTAVPKSPIKNDYYVDRKGMNRVIVDRNRVVQTIPPKYHVVINDNKLLLSEKDIKDVIRRIKGQQVNEQLFKSLPAN